MLYVSIWKSWATTNKTKPPATFIAPIAVVGPKNSLASIQSSIPLFLNLIYQLYCPAPHFLLFRLCSPAALAFSADQSVGTWTSVDEQTARSILSTTSKGIRISTTQPGSFSHCKESTSPVALHLHHWATSTVPLTTT